jgi:hypothetical protein
MRCMALDHWSGGRSFTGGLGYILRNKALARHSFILENGLEVADSERPVEDHGEVFQNMHRSGCEFDRSSPPHG